MKYIILIWLVFLFFIDSDPARAQNITEIIVSANGSDKNPGTIEKPLKTFSKSLEVVRQLRVKNPDSKFDIQFRGGTYFLTCAIEMNKLDNNIVVRAYNNEKVIFHGGIKLSNSAFRLTKTPGVLERLLPESRGKVWEINLKKIGITDYGTLKQHGFGTIPEPTSLELFIDEKPYCLARYPNDGKLKIGRVYDKGSVPRDGDYSGRGGEIGFEYERPERWKLANDIWLHGKFSFGYNDDHLKVEKIDFEKRSFKIVQPHLYGLRTSTIEYVDQKNHNDVAGLGVRGYYAYNLLEELDQPGEFYIDRQKGIMYVYPDKELPNADIEISLLEVPFIQIKNSSKITIESIDFKCGRGMAIYLENCSNVTINDCKFSNLGTVAISMGQRYQGNIPSYNLDGSPKQEMTSSGDFKNITVSNCVIHHTGTGGIILSGGDRKKLISGGNCVINTEFYENERINQTYSPSIRINGVGNAVKNCDFHDLDHQAIQFIGNDHVIEFNRFNKVCTDADDMGAIYTGRDPSSRGTVIQYNYFSNIVPPNNKTSMCGIYFDDGSGGMTIRKNIFYKVGSIGFGSVFMHGGHDNLIEENVFMDCPMAVGHAFWNNDRYKKYISENALIQERIKKIVDIESDVYLLKYPSLKDFFTRVDNRFNTVSNNLFIRSQSCQMGYLSLKGNKTLLSDATVPENLNWQEINLSNKEIEPFPFDKVGVINSLKNSSR